MSNWVTISKDKESDAFYPVAILSKKLDSLGMTFSDAVSKPDSFWHDKNVLLHCMWKKEYQVWRNIISNVSKYSNNLVIEFDADDHIPNIEKLEIGMNQVELLAYLRKYTNKFIWEVPLKYNPFLIGTIRTKLHLYDKVWKKDITDVNKDIDFFALVDTPSSSNLSSVVTLLTRLQYDGYKICLLILDKYKYEFYKDRIDIPSITNSRKFSNESVKRYESLLMRSKVFIDLGTRMTTGRTVYDALYRGAVPVYSNTYGCNLVNIGGVVESRAINLLEIYTLCRQIRSNWSIKYLDNLHSFNDTYNNVNITVNELRRITDG